MEKIKIKEIKCAESKLSNFCHLTKEQDMIYVSQWDNGEGFDVTIQRDGATLLQLTYGELKAINTLVTYLEIQ